MENKLSPKFTATINNIATKLIDTDEPMFKDNGYYLSCVLLVMAVLVVDISLLIHIVRG